MKSLYATGLCLILYIAVLIQPSVAIDTSVCSHFEEQNDTVTCELPSCYCNATKIPGDLPEDITPQIVLFTYSGSITEEIKALLSNVFSDKYRNSNGCPIGITIFPSNRSTHYCSVHQLYVRGHDIATFGLNGTNVEGLSNVDWNERFLKHKDMLIQQSYLPDDHVVGARAPDFLLGGEKQFRAIQEGAFKYDSSIMLRSTEPIWPFTLNMDVGKFFEDSCVNQKKCPKSTYPDLWEVAITPITRKGRTCWTLDDCVHSNAHVDEVAEVLRANLNNSLRHKNRAPFLINLQEKVLKTASAREGLRVFIEEHLVESNVWFLTISEMLAWVGNPTEISQLEKFEPWDCPERNYFPVCERACYKKASDKALGRGKNPFRDLLPVEELWLYQTISLIVAFIIIYRMDKLNAKK